MPTLPPLTQLRAFEAAARHLSFKKAAGELSVTPTAISHQIKLLERHCRRLLFQRRPRPLKLTSAGDQLFPVVREGFEAFADALTAIRSGVTGGRLRITATNAFAARWLVPRLPNWRAAHPRLMLDIIGTDAVLDLNAGDADIAIRYARKPPPDYPWIALMRDSFRVVASPKLVGSRGEPLSPAEIATFPLIEIEWSSTDHGAPTWQRWQALARRRRKNVTDLALLPSLAFREEFARNRGCDFRTGCRNLQRYSGRTGACKRRTCRSVKACVAWLRLLHRAPRPAPKARVNQCILGLDALSEMMIANRHAAVECRLRVKSVDLATSVACRLNLQYRTYRSGAANATRRSRDMACRRAMLSEPEGSVTLVSRLVVRDERVASPL